MYKKRMDERINLMYEKNSFWTSIRVESMFRTKRDNTNDKHDQR